MTFEFKSRTSWRAKLERVQQPKVVQIPPKMQRQFGTGTMLIPKPLDVDDLVRHVKRGHLVTGKEIRRALAERSNADVTCPLTTGIFLRIAAETAEEDAQLGKKRITPYWRVVRDDGALNPKMPGGVERQKARLEAEGHTVVDGKIPKVQGFEKSLVKF